MRCWCDSGGTLVGHHGRLLWLQSQRNGGYVRAVCTATTPNSVGITELIKKEGCSGPSPKWRLGDVFKTWFPPIASPCGGGQKAFVSPWRLDLARNRKVRQRLKKPQPILFNLRALCERGGLSKRSKSLAVFLPWDRFQQRGGGREQCTRWCLRLIGATHFTAEYRLKIEALQGPPSFLPPPELDSSLKNSQKNKPCIEGAAGGSPKQHPWVLRPMATSSREKAITSKGPSRVTGRAGTKSALISGAI